MSHELLSIGIYPLRASFYLRVPAGRNNSVGFLDQISYEVNIHFIPNLTYLLLLQENVLFFKYYRKTHKLDIY